MTEHLCCTCPVLRPTQEPRVYERAQVCEGCRARLRSLLADLLDAYAHLELERPSSVGAKVSGSRTPPIPLSEDALDLTMPPHATTVEDDLVPLYERFEVQVGVWRPARPDEEYTKDKVTMSSRRRARDANGVKAYGLSGDQTGHTAVAAVLDSWVRDWQTYRWELLPEPNVSSLVGWLGGRLEWACNSHPAVDSFADELGALVMVVRSVAGLTRPKAELKLGVPCRECEKVTLYRWPGSDYIECGSCPALLRPEEFERWTSLIAAPEWADWTEQTMGPERLEQGITVAWCRDCRRKVEVGPDGHLPPCGHETVAPQREDVA